MKAREGERQNIEKGHTAFKGKLWSRGIVGREEREGLNEG